MSRIILLVVTLCFTAHAIAQNDGSQFTSFGNYQLGQTTLTQIAQSLGAAKFVATGEAGEYQVAICYRTPKGIVHFFSGEMGGQDQELLGFGIGIADAAQPCSSFPMDRTPKSLNLAGLRLGMTRAEFANVVKTDVRWEREIGRAFFESRRPMSPDEINNFPQDLRGAILSGATQNYYDVGISIVSTVENNKLIKVEVWKVETY